MKVAIMQPYFFPYLGYFQLINEVDTFVFLDDVNYIKKGWINRNNICLNGKTHLLTIPLIKPSQNRLINEIEVSINRKEIDRIIQTVKQAYSKSQNNSMVNRILDSSLSEDFKNISEINKEGIRLICKYLEIKTQIVDSSSIFSNADLKGQDRIIDICNQLSASEYVNPIGGKSIYQTDKFKEHGIELLFHQKESVNYKQLSDNFIDNLSILDIVANVDIEFIKQDLLNRMHYEG